MKKIASVLLLSSAVAAPAFAADGGFYAGVTLGRSSTGNIAGNTVMTKSSDTVAGVLAGYQFNRNWGVEAQFTGAGKFDASVPGALYTGKSDAFAITAVGTAPLSDSFSVYAKLGIASVNTTLSSSPATTDTGVSRSAVTGGLGGQYNVTSGTGIRFGWDRYGAAVKNGAGAKINHNADVYSLGVVFAF